MLFISCNIFTQEYAGFYLVLFWINLCKQDLYLYKVTRCSNFKNTSKITKYLYRCNLSIRRHLSRPLWTFLWYLRLKGSPQAVAWCTSVRAYQYTRFHPYQTLGMPRAACLILSMMRSTRHQRPLLQNCESNVASLRQIHRIQQSHFL